MSEEEDIFFCAEDDDDGNNNMEDIEYQEADRNLEEEVLNTPENKYKMGKEQLGFDDLYAIDVFYDVFCDQRSSQELQAKAIKKAAITLSQHDDFPRVLNSLTDVFDAHLDGILSDELCTKIVKAMMNNLIRSESALTDFLELATERVNKSTQSPLFVELKLKQAELALKRADYDKVQEILSEVEQTYVCIPPDPKDILMCYNALNILILKIQLIEASTKSEEEMINCYELCKQIQNVSLTEIQKAVMIYIEGLQALHKIRDFKQAKQKFESAFKLFDEAANDRRLDCLPFLALSIMCSHEDSMFFDDNQIAPYLTHPIVAPLKQLFDAYRKPNYLTFIDLLDSAKQVFLQKISPANYYCSLLDEIRLFVLRNHIAIFCSPYKRIQIKFISEKLKCDKDEAQNLIFELIITRKMHALVDLENEMVIMKEQVPKSQYLEGVSVLISSMETLVDQMTNKLILK